MKSIWTSLPTPTLLLAPMEGVTDTVFRRIVALCAKPDLSMTEFTNVEGYFSIGKERIAESLRFTPEEQPLIAQIWGNNPETMEQMAIVLCSMGFVGIDINMGCPDRNVMAHGCGAALIETPDIAKALVKAVKRGIESSGRDIPVSVKTRLGLKNIQTHSWISFLLEQGLDALTVHARTAKELSKVPAHWDEIEKVVTLRDTMGIATKIIGNGDVKDAKDAKEKSKQHGVDGVMIGRGIFENMWAFDRSEHPHVGTTSELFGIMKTHIQMFEKEWGNTKNYATLKKFFKIYIKGFDGASEVRDRIMQTNTSKEALAILDTLSFTN